jgi:hypothetical protein
MEPYIPIPGKPPRQVVIDRQRKLFTSLSIEDLLLELVNLKFLRLYRVLTTRILRKIKQIGFLLSLLMTQNTIADSQTNGLNMEMTQSQGDSALFLVKAYGLMKMEEVIGDLS